MFNLFKLFLDKMNRISTKQFVSAFLSLFFFFLSNFAICQEKSDKNKHDDKDKALSFFIDGKTMELKNNYIDAVENYITALKYDDSPGIRFALAEVYYKLYKLDLALTEIKIAINQDPKNQEYLETLANIYIEKKDFVNAIKIYEKIISLDSNYTYGLYSLARMYQEIKMTDKALEVYEKITNKIGYDFDVLNKMYEIYMSYKNYPKAIEVLENIEKLDPYNVLIKKLLASLYLKNNQLTEAKNVFEDIFKINPDDKEVQSELVKIYFKDNQSDKAFENFSKMLGKDSLGYLEKVQIGELYFNMIVQDKSAASVAENIFLNLNSEYPDNWIPYYYLGALKSLENNKSLTREYFDKAVSNADTSREVYVNVGLTYYQQGESENAIEILNKGLESFPEDFRLNYIKGLTLQGMNNEAAAIAFFEKAVSGNPNDVSILSTLALAYDNQKDYEKSENTYERALKIDPQNSLVLNNYAYNLSERNKDLDKALSMAKIAIEKDPDNASYLDTIGWIYFKMKKYKSAKEFIEKSLNINGNSAVVLEHLGDVFFAMNDYYNANKYWKLSLEKNPSNQLLKEKINFTKTG